MSILCSMKSPIHLLAVRLNRRARRRQRKCVKDLERSWQSRFLFGLDLENHTRSSMPWRLPSSFTQSNFEKLGNGLSEEKDHEPEHEMVIFNFDTVLNWKQTAKPPPLAKCHTKIKLKIAQRFEWNRATKGWIVNIYKTMRHRKSFARLCMRFWSKRTHAPGRMMGRLKNEAARADCKEIDGLAAVGTWSITSSRMTW